MVVANSQEHLQREEKSFRDRSIPEDHPSRLLLRSAPAGIFNAIHLGTTNTVTANRLI
jgi:hypothetical protein